MAVTETETISYGSRISGSFKGMLGGILMFLAAFPILFVNEGRAVKTARALDEGESVVVDVESNKTVDEENEGKLVHVTGKAETKAVLQDAAFGVSENAIRLERRVEIFQWIENKEVHEKKNVGGSVTKTTTYTYEQAWVDRPVNSAGFKEAGHDNPPGMEFKSEAWQAENVSFGAYTLNEDQIGRIGGAKPYEFPADFTCRVDRVQISGNYVYVPEKATRQNKRNNRDVESQTRPGDLRVSYRVVRPHSISVVAKQRDGSFVPFVSKKGGGHRVDLLQDGVHDADEMFESARSGNTVLTWILRVIGFFLMFAGLKSILAPLPTLGDVLPILGSILGFGTGLVAGVLALAFSLVTIAIAWLFYRPVLAGVLLAVAAVVVFLLWKKRAAGRTRAAVAAAPSGTQA